MIGSHLVDVKELQRTLIEALAQIREKQKRYTDKDSKLILNSKQETLEQILVYLSNIVKEENVDMKTELGSKLIVEIVKMDDIERRQRKSVVKSQLLAAIERLRPGEGAIVKMTAQNLSQHLGRLKKKKLIENDEFRTTVDKAGNVILERLSA